MHQFMTYSIRKCSHLTVVIDKVRMYDEEINNDER